MKAVLIALILLAGGGGYFTASQMAKKDKAAALAAAEARFQAEREQQGSTKTSARPAIQTVTPKAAPTAPAQVVSSQDPSQILARLVAIRVPPGAQGTWAIRKVVHELENLAETGQAAVPVIAQFLNEFQDVDYVLRDEDEGEATQAAALTNNVVAAGDAGRGNDEQGRERRRGENNDGRGPRGGERGFGDRGGPGFGAMFADAFRPNRRVRLDFTYPPSLRIGLFDVLRQIGGPQAEGALTEALGSTGRPVEVAYLAKTLQEMQPNVYKENAIGAAKELLLDPPQLSSANRLDRDGKSYLFHVLAMYNDTSFVNMAQNIMITPDGRLDRNTFDYLRGLGQQGIPGLMQAYNDARLTNLAEKASIANTVLGYVGKDANANAMLQQVLADQSVPGRLRSMALMRLMRQDEDPNLAAQRIPIVQQAKAMSNDPDVQRAADMAIAGLTKIQNGERPEMRDFFRGMMGDGAGGGRPNQVPGGEQGGRRRQQQPQQ